jgi:hypothetical protein
MNKNECRKLKQKMCGRYKKAFRKEKGDLLNDIAKAIGLKVI